MTNKTMIIKKYIYQTIGMLLLGAGIAFNSASLFGTDPMSVFLVGGAKSFGVTMGTINIFVCIFWIAFAYIFNRETVTFATVLSMLTSSFGIDFTARFLPTSPSMPLRIILMCIGITIYTFGTAFSQFPQCGYSTYDCFIFALAKLFKTDSYHTIRWGTDISFMVVGWLLGGKVGLCTIILMITAGKLIEFFLEQIKKYVVL